MDANLSTDPAVLQAELVRLRAEAAAAEARAALAKAEAELVRAKVAASQVEPATAAASALVPVAILAAPQVPAAAATVAMPSVAAPSFTRAPSPPPFMKRSPGTEAPAVGASPATTAAPARTLEWTAPRRVEDSGPAASAVVPPPVAAPPAETDREPPEPWLTRGLYWATTACGSSMVVHLLLILLLGLLVFPKFMQPEVHELVASVAERPEEMISQFLETDITPTKELALVSSSPSTIQGALGAAPSISQPRTQAEVSDTPSEVKVDVGEANIFASDGKRMSQELPEGSFGDPQQVVADYNDAMDRITQEILAKLAKGKVLVMWCFDQSESMKDDRQEIRDRIERVYTELGLATAAKGDALLTSVTSYGKDTLIHTPQPTSDLDKIRAAMDEVPNDPSGLEMQCHAVGQVIAGHRRAATTGRRQMMLIMVTDESGDQESNVQYLEATIAEAKLARCPIYVLGREAVFGYPYAHMVTTVSAPAVGGGTVSRTFILPIDRGPETPYVEQLQTDGFQARQDAHPSGFGAFEQCRMARQTGGIMFLLPSPEVRLFERDNRKYALDSMRPYLPDLSTRADYANERDKFPMRAMLWKVISDLNPYRPEIGRYINVRQRFSNDPSTFVTQVRAEQEKAKQFVIYLDAAEHALEGMKTQRTREVSPRWQANYDLIYAQVLAYKVRIYEYGAYLEEFIKNPKKPDLPKPDRVLAHWDLRTRKQTITGSQTVSYIERSREKFEETIRLHPGTPWAARAEMELRRGFGVELFAVYRNPLAVGRAPVRPIVPPKL